MYKLTEIQEIARKVAELSLSEKNKTPSGHCSEIWDAFHLGINYQKLVDGGGEDSPVEEGP